MTIALRRIFMGAVGCLTVAATQPSPDTRDGSAQDLVIAKIVKPAPPSPLNPPEVRDSEYERPCQVGVENRKSDLCAQWKAADAASDAAFWAHWSFILGLFGTLGLFATLYYTRKAVNLANETARDAEEALKIAARNADAAAEQVRVSEKTATHQLRAYVGVESVSLETELPTFSTSRNKVTVILKNFGQTPARVHAFLWLTVKEDQNAFSVPDHVPPREYLAPGATTTVIRHLDLSGDESTHLRQGRNRLRALLRFEYEDIYGASHGHDISWVSWNEDYRRSHLERLDEKRATYKESEVDTESIATS
jgi:hypothetical protein